MDEITVPIYLTTGFLSGKTSFLALPSSRTLPYRGKDTSFCEEERKSTMKRLCKR